MLKGEEVLGLLQRRMTGTACIDVLIERPAIWRKDRKIPVTVAQFVGECFSPAPLLLHHRDCDHLVADTASKGAGEDIAIGVLASSVDLTNQDGSVRRMIWSGF